MNSQSIKIFVGFFLIIIFFLSANLISGIIFPSESEIPQTDIIDHDDFQSPQTVISQTFPFETIVVTLSFPVNVSILETTKNAGKIALISSNDSGPGGIADGYRSIVKNTLQEQIFSGLLEELNKVKRLQGLSDDEYLELMAVYVQSLRYESLEQSPAKFPVETIVDRAGDCDDKSLLLAGLLAQEGYSVALLSFGPEAHMAIGVGSSDHIYKKTGYAFIETTGYSFVGAPADKLGGNLSLFSDPTIIVISSGKKLYTSGNETRYIHDSYLKSDQRVKELSLQLKSLYEDLMAKQIRIGELDLQIAELKKSSNIREYNSQVQTYSTLVSIYNSRFASYRKIYAEYEKYADIHNYILQHKYDRKGVYDYVTKNMPP